MIIVIAPLMYAYEVRSAVSDAMEVDECPLNGALQARKEGRPLWYLKPLRADVGYSVDPMRVGDELRFQGRWFTIGENATLVEKT